MVAMGFAYACRSWLFLQDEEMGDRGDGYPDRHYYTDALPVLIVVHSVSLLVTLLRVKNVQHSISGIYL